MLTIIKTKIPQFLPHYLCFTILVLTISILFLDTQDSISIFLILLSVHICMLLYLAWKSQHRSQKTKIPSLSDFRNNNQRPAKLVSFEAEAQSILRQINMENNVKINQMKYYSPYSHSPKQPLSLSQITSSINQYPQDTNIFGTYNIQTWREQFRLALQQFKKNINIGIYNKKNYQLVINKLNLNLEKLTEAEDIVENFLKDRAIQYCTYTIKVVNQINKLLSRNFGLSLTKVPSTSNKQIGMQQFYRLLDYYINNRSLPSLYKTMSISSPTQTFGISQFDLSLGRQSLNKLQTDMLQLVKYSKILQPMLMFPQQRFNSSLLVYILRSEFSNEKIEINSQNIGYNGHVVDNSNIFNNIFLSNATNYVHVFMVQVDYWISLQSMPEFRTKNCKFICLIFLLVLIKRQSSVTHPMLRTLRKLLK